MAAAAILKNRQKRYISATVRPTATKFGMMMQVDHLDRSDRQISDRK